MFTDKRSKKVIFIAHCILNQNTKLDCCAHFPGAVKEVIELLIANDIGIIQMPCPEMLYLGLNRETDVSAKPTIEEEDTRIYERMLEKGSQALCEKIVNEVIYQIKDYQYNNFEVVGLIGINGSPTCGIETTWKQGKEINEKGVFIKMLVEELAKNHISVTMTGVKVYQINEALEAIKKLLDK